jgi:hypothetical protein
MNGVGIGSNGAGQPNAAEIKVTIFETATIYPTNDNNITAAYQKNSPLPYQIIMCE